MRCNAIQYIIPALILSASCSNNNKQTEGDTITFELSQFHEVNLSNSARIITDNPDILGIPVNISAINDSIIAVYSDIQNQRLILYNTRSGKYQVAVKKGDGPLELLGISSMSTDDDGILWLAGSLDRKVLTTKWNEEGNDAMTELKFRSSENLLRGVTDGKGGILGLPGVHRSVRIIKTDNAGNPIDSLGSFPQTALPDSITPDNFLFQSDIAYSPTADKLVIANLSWNEMEICTLSDGSDKIIKYPLKQDIEIKRRDFGFGYSYNPRPFWFMFSKACAGDKSFTVGFKGVEVKSDEDFERGIKKVLEFDWDGKPQRSLSFGEEIVTYDMDFKNKVIYTIENRPEPTLVKYQL